MKTRERTLLIVVGAVVGLLVVRTVVGRYTGVLRGYDTQIAQLHKDLDKSQQEKAKAQDGRTQWLEIGAQTLSMDGNEATTRLREEMTKLTEKSGLREVEVSLESMQTWMTNRVRVLNFSVSGQGKLDDVVAFLFELHRQPYAVRVKSLTLDLVAKPTRRKETTAGQRGLLSMKARLDTLILPANQMVAKIESAGLEAGKRKEVKRTELAGLVDYKPLLDKKLFQPYEPPPPPAPRIVDRPKQPVKVTGQPVQQVVQPPPPADAQMVLGRLLSSPRGQLAVLEDRRKPNMEDTYKEVGEEMYGGTLVFVHPSGAVTQKDGQFWFHAIGEPLQNCKPLTEQDQPVVYSELMKLVSEATGISRRPG